MDHLWILVIILPPSTVAKKIILQNYAVWNDWYQKFIYCIRNNILVEYVMVFGLEPEDGSVITPMALAHLLYPIRSRSRNKCRNMCVGWCVSSWRPCFWSAYSICYYTYTMYYSCILSNQNKLFLRDIYIPRVGVAMTVFWMIWYCYSFLPGFKCIFQLCSSWFAIS